MAVESVSPAIFEQFLDAAQRAIATQDLAAQGEGAVPVLTALFDGTAKNRFGIPYRQLGIPLDCALVAAARLGPIAIPLEPHLRAEVLSGHPYASSALAALGVLQDGSVAVLASQLDADHLLAAEAASALVRTGNTLHVAVKAATTRSTRAEAAIQRAEKYGRHL